MLMSQLPVFTKSQADRILKRAGEIEGGEDSNPLTVDDLRSIAGEAGFGARAVERAIAEAQQVGPGEIHRDPVHKSGLVITHLTTVRAVPLQISSEQLMRAVRLFQPYREGHAQINLEEHQIAWRDRRGIHFTVTSGGGMTEIRVMVSKLLLRKRRWIRWVKMAADKMETLVYLIASQELGRGESRAELPESSSRSLAP